MSTTFTFVDFLGLGFVTAIVNQLLGVLVQTFNSQREMKSKGRHLALQLATLLERFAIDCADAISDIELWQDSNGAAGRSDASLPEFPALPGDASWHLLRGNLASRVASLPNERLLAAQAIATSWLLDGDEDGKYVAQRSGWCGYRAWLLAEDIRATHEQPRADRWVITWDVAGTLRKQHDVFKSGLEKRVAQ